jgi:HAD superfamily hydrolase (TIGR01484 family)
MANTRHPGADSKEQTCREISLIAVDLDGTLLTSEHVLAPEGVRLLQRAHRAGVRVVLSTTRTPPSALAFWRALQIGDPIICTNGAQIWASPDGPSWAEHTFSRQVALALARLADARGWELSTTVGATSYWRQRPGQPLGPCSPHVTVVRSNATGIAGDPVRILVSQPAAIDGIREMCETRYIGRCQVEVYAGADGVPHSLGVFGPRVTKGAGLALVCRQLGIAHHAVLAIGDNACDLAMFPFAGVRVVMANAPEDVLCRAMALNAVVAPSNDEEGVAWAVRKYVFAAPASAR